MFRSLLSKWADSTLQRRIEALERELADVRTELAAEQRRHRVLEAEIESLAGVVVRDRERVRAESAIAAGQIANIEGKPDGRAHRGDQ
jgi:predicted  nucleic acid-binding Zn-ribbon protein